MDALTAMSKSSYVQKEVLGGSMARPGRFGDGCVRVNYLDADKRIAVLSFPVARNHDCFARLTMAEREVTALLLAGASYADIAHCRESSTRTVANQVASVFRKLGVHSRAELTVLVASEMNDDPTAGGDLAET